MKTKVHLQLEERLFVSQKCIQAAFMKLLYIEAKWQPQDVKIYKYAECREIDKNPYEMEMLFKTL